MTGGSASRPLMGKPVGLGVWGQGRGTLLRVIMKQKGQREKRGI